MVLFWVSYVPFNVPNCNPIDAFIGKNKFGKDIFGNFEPITKPNMSGVGFTEKEAKQAVARKVFNYYKTIERTTIIKPIQKEYLKFCM